MKIVSREQSLRQYEWGSNCIAWSLADEPGLSVKLESMPPGSSEQEHFHKYAQQFFFILRGEANFVIEQDNIRVEANQGIKINPNQKHFVSNLSDTALEFLLISQPSTENDRFLAG